MNVVKQWIRRAVERRRDRKIRKVSNELTRAYMRLHSREMNQVVREAQQVGLFDMKQSQLRAIARRAAKDPGICSLFAELDASGFATR